MKSIIVAVLAAFLLGAAPAAAHPQTQQRIVLAGGCFWGMQLVFESLKGVYSTEAGYAGGDASNATYERVSSGETGHAESVAITYDPNKITLRQLLDVYFFVAHDPTQRDRQGPDVGSQYRSEVFYTTSQQRSETVALIADLQRRHAFSAPITTEIAPLRGFYAAEAYHQHYAVHNPNNPYIAINDVPKLQALRDRYPSLVRADAPRA